MAKIQLVVEIDELIYKFIKAHKKEKPFGWLSTKTILTNAIINGEPLPKHHGRLKDVDAFLSKVKADREHSAYLRSWTADDVLTALDNTYTPTIIETESEEVQPKQTDDSYFDFDKVKENLKRDDFSDLVVDHTCEGEQEQTRDEKMIDAIDFAIKATDSQDDYSMGMRNGMRYAKSLIDGKEPQCELRRTDEEIKFGIDIGDEVVSDYGAKGVVVGIDTHKKVGVMLSLLMRNHKVPQLVEASRYKKTGKYFPLIIEVLEQIKGEVDGK